MYWLVDKKVSGEVVKSRNNSQRVFDLSISFFFVLLFSPLLAAISFWLLITQGIPIFYRELRVGQHGITFAIYKFRTMKVGANLKATVATDTDPDITCAGKLLKPSRLDELPQLFNVIKGDMSIIGPRPLSPKHLHYLDEDNAKALAETKPGMMNPAILMFIAEDQVLRTMPEPEEAYLKVFLPEKVRLQVIYEKNRTFLKDISTLFVVGRGIWSQKIWEQSRMKLNHLLKEKQLLDC